MSTFSVIAIIPARMKSSRFPGKPLLEVHGLPMIEHVRRRTLLCEEFADVVVATCDPEIRDVVSQHGGTVVMTADTHIMASDRVAEAAKKVSNCSHVVNVQGDEILVHPKDLQAMIHAMVSQPSIDYWNAVAPIEFEEELVDISIVKCVVSKSNRIMYCARDFQHLNLKSSFQPVKKVLGVLGYSYSGLQNYSRLSRTPIEETQSIDQSRIIEHDIPLMGVPFASGYPGINEQREYEAVLKILSQDQEQQNILEKILE